MNLLLLMVIPELWPQTVFQNFYLYHLPKCAEILPSKDFFFLNNKKISSSQNSVPAICCLYFTFYDEYLLRVYIKLRGLSKFVCMCFMHVNSCKKHQMVQNDYEKLQPIVIFNSQSNDCIKIVQIG